MAGIAIVDYGMANLRSVQKAFERVGHDAIITSSMDDIAKCDRLVVPGVGAFRDAIGRLRETKLDQPILDVISSGRPTLGICLGLQLLFTTSEEEGRYEGLNVLEGEVVRFQNMPGLKVPHMGWNQPDFVGDCPLFRGIKEKSSVYFVHGYYAKPKDTALISATADYPTPFAAAVWKDNLYATQFHPEKSQSVGLAMLKNFAEL